MAGVLKLLSHLLPNN